MKKKVKVIRCNFLNGIIRWQISKSVKVILSISALIVYKFVRMLSPFQIYYNSFTLKIGQGHAVQFSYCHLFMANVKIYKRSNIFALANTVFEILKLNICDLQK